MSVASWLHPSKRALTAVLSKSARRKPLRRPAHSRPSLECLEARVVPDAAAGNLGVVTNSAVNFQSGITLVPNPPSAVLSGLAVGAFANYFNALGGLSPGQQLGLGLPTNLPNFFQNVQGFGSGTQPNQPWVPNAYNLGLANQQWAFPSMSDLGFQAPAPWLRQIAQHRPNDAPLDSDEKDASPRTYLAVLDDTSDDKPADQTSLDESAGAASEEQSEPDSDLEARPIPFVPHAARKTDAAEAAVERAALSSKETDDPDDAPHAAPTSWHEEDVFLGTLSARRMHDSEALDARNEGGRAPSALLSEKDPFVMDNGEKVVPALDRLNLSSTFALSVLTPAQFMALLVEWPASPVPMDDCEEDESPKESE